MAGLRYVLEVEPMDLGPGVKAVGLELVEIESREPARGGDAARIWSAAVSALPAADPWGLDFFAHLDRVREFCSRRAVLAEQKASGHLLVIPSPAPSTLVELIERFAGETFGIRAGAKLEGGDPALEGDLARRGVDAYDAPYRDYTFCGVCDFENGFLTLLTEKLWVSEVLRRVKPALVGLPVEAARPQ